VRLNGGNFEFDLTVIEFALAQFLTKFLPRRRIPFLGLVDARIARRRQQRIEDAIFGSILRLVPDFARGCFARFLDGNFHQIPDDGIDVAPNVTHFCEFGGLDLDERCLRELCQTARDLRLTDAGRTDHEDILRRDLLA